MFTPSSSLRFIVGGLPSLQQKLQPSLLPRNFRELSPLFFPLPSTMRGHWAGRSQREARWTSRRHDAALGARRVGAIGHGTVAAARAAHEGRGKNTARRCSARAARCRRQARDQDPSSLRRRRRGPWPEVAQWVLHQQSYVRPQDQVPR